MWEYIQPFRPEHSQRPTLIYFSFFLIPKAKPYYPQSPIPLKSLGSVTFLLCSPFSVFLTPHRTLLHRASHNPNHFSPSLAVRREPTIPGGCQNSLALAAMLSPSHRPADLGSPKGTQSQWLRCVWLAALMRTPTAIK